MDQWIYGDMLNYLTESLFDGHSGCACVGPQNNEPFCPCRMNNIIIKDGKAYEKVSQLVSKDEIDEIEKRMFDGQILNKFFNNGRVGAISFIRHTKGWALADCKEYFDNLVHYQGN